MRILGAARQWAFVTVSALIMVVASERIFWYYTDAGVAAFAELAVFYSLAVYALFWFIERYRVDDIWSLLVAVPVFGYVVEGIITPVIYSGGPLPVFPVWFSAWHGGLGTLLVWFLIRRLLITARVRATLGLAIGLGLFWGTWATTMWLPENLNDPELAESAPRIRSAADFFGYAVISSGVLIAAHWSLGKGLWVARYRPSRLISTLAAVGCMAVAVAYSFVYPWAAPMFVVLMGGVAWVLRRHATVATGPNLFEQLDGPVSLRALAMLAALPLSAGGTYALLIEIDPPEWLIRSAFMYGTIAVQSVMAGLVMVWSAVKVMRRSSGRSKRRRFPNRTGSGTGTEPGAEAQGPLTRS